MNPPDHHGQSEAARYAVSSQSAAVRPPEQQFAGPPLMRSCRLLLHCCLPCPSRMHRPRPGVQCHRITPYQPRMHIAKSQRTENGKGRGHQPPQSMPSSRRGRPNRQGQDVDLQQAVKALGRLVIQQETSIRDLAPVHGTAHTQLRSAVVGHRKLRGKLHVKCRPMICYPLLLRALILGSRLSSRLLTGGGH